MAVLTKYDAVPSCCRYPAGCAPSTVMRWGYAATCCINACEYSTNNGKGDICRPIPRTRPAPITSTTPRFETSTTEMPCPASCAATMTQCLAKGYKVPDCLQYAKKGYLCHDTAGKGAAGKAVSCNAQNILPAANEPACRADMSYSSCGGCQATCENTRPTCTPSLVRSTSPFKPPVSVLLV